MQPRSEDLESRLRAANTPRKKIDLLNQMAWELHHSDPMRSRELCLQAQELARNPLYEDGLARSLAILSALEWDKSDYPEAIALAVEAQKLFQQSGNLGQQAFITNHMASISFYLGDYAHALELGFEALKLVEASGERDLQASLLNDVAYYQIHLGQFDLALPQLFKSLEMQRELGSKPGEAQTLDSLGKAYYLMGNYPQALEYEFQSLELNRMIGFRRSETEALHNIGKIYAASGDLANAFTYFEQALTLAREQEYRQFEAAILLDMGQGYLSKQEPDHALQLLVKGLEVAQGIHSTPVIFEIHQMLARVYEQTGDFANALKHFKLFHNLREAILNEKSNSRLHTLQVIHETQIYQLRNVALQKEIEEREKLITELDAFAYSVAHDIKNPLSIILGYSEILEEAISAGEYDIAKPMTASLAQASRKVSQIVDELLLLARVRQQEVTVAPLDMAAILALVENRLRKQIEESHAEISKPQTWPVALGYAPWIEEVWANYMTNAIHYGGTPPRIELGATPEEQYIRFWIRDNGNGIQPDDQKRLFVPFKRLDHAQAGSGHGLGLSIVKRIVDKLGGTVGIESTGLPGQGCTFSFTLPIASNPLPES